MESIDFQVLAVTAPLVASAIGVLVLAELGSQLRRFWRSSPHRHPVRGHAVRVRR